jgi:exodeoxyribonuclease VII large subunit
MSEKVKDLTVFSLSDVLTSIRKTIENRYKSSFWVKAEMNKLNYYSHSGHCYPDLVEKQDGRVIAQMRSVLWRDDYKRINQVFMKTLNEPLKDGIKLLLLAKISFDSAHGLNLQILDIDPDYTLGDLEREKQETIRRLREEGIFDRNKTLKMPLLPQRIAVISVETSKGYMDFLGKINNNQWGYRLVYQLFPSLLQGEGMIPALTAQLERIRGMKDDFDVVAIIRGGGGEVGLASYNKYELAKEIAMFPLPILTGIGHITNETVAEMVAYKNLITPTDLAMYVLQSFHDFSATLKQSEQRIMFHLKRIVDGEMMRFQSLANRFRAAAGSVLQSYLSNLSTLQGRLTDKALWKITSETVWLNNTEKNVNNMSPREVMRRGYSITMLNGKVVKNPAQAKSGDVLESLVFEGEIISIVK